MFLYEETLVLGSQIVTPLARELKFLTVLNRLLQDVDTFGIRQTHELRVNNTLQTLNQTFVHKLIQELQIIHTMIQRPANAVFDEVLFQIHQLVLLNKCHFRFDHPELCQVTRRVAVLCAEGRTEGVDLS